MTVNGTKYSEHLQNYIETLGFCMREGHLHPILSHSKRIYLEYDGNGVLVISRSVVFKEPCSLAIGCCVCGIEVGVAMS